jgi:NAD(P)-dependent dehydrogenase (short-subunit alcohol dehydrogenase family)
MWPERCSHHAWAEKEQDLTGYENVKLFKLNVTDVVQVRAATEQALAAFGKIDVVVTNAGPVPTALWNSPGKTRSTGSSRSTCMARSNVIYAFYRTAAPTKAACSSASAR